MRRKMEVVNGPGFGGIKDKVLFKQTDSFGRHPRAALRRQMLLNLHQRCDSRRNNLVYA